MSMAPSSLLEDIAQPGTPDLTIILKPTKRPGKDGHIEAVGTSGLIKHIAAVEHEFPGV